MTTGELAQPVSCSIRSLIEKWIRSPLILSPQVVKNRIRHTDGSARGLDPGELPRVQIYAGGSRAWAGWLSV